MEHYTRNSRTDDLFRLYSIDLANTLACDLCLVRHSITKVED